MDKVSQQEIKSQLAKIVATVPFTRSRILGKFLNYIVDEYLNDNHDKIKAYSIAVSVFDRPDHFDAQTDSIVRVYGGKLRRELKFYYENSGKNDTIIITVPKGSYIPHIYHRDSELQGEAETRSLADGGFQTEIDRSHPTVGIMMFDCLNDKEQYGYLATGLSEEIIIRMTRFPEILVVGPLFRNLIQSLDTGDIGRKYGVHYLLDGSIRTRGKTLRVSVKLTDALKSEHLWAQSLDYNLDITPIVEIEDDVVDRVVSTIADAYGIIPRILTKESFVNQKPRGLSDYEAILRYYHHFYVLTEKSHSDAVEALQKTIQRDSNNAQTLAMLGDLIVSTYIFGQSSSTSQIDEAEKLGKNALAQDPNCQTAHFVISLVHFLKFRKNDFLKGADKSLQLNPNHALYKAALALHIAMVGEWERGIELMKKAMRLNPHHPGWYHLVDYMNYYRQGEFELALIEAGRFNIPAFFWDPLIRAAVLGQLDRQKEAEKALQELLNLLPDFKQQGKDLIKRLVYLDEHVEMVWDGLEKAGIEKLDN